MSIGWNFGCWTGVPAAIGVSDDCFLVLDRNIQKNELNQPMMLASTTTSHKRLSGLCPLVNLIALADIIKIIVPSEIQLDTTNLSGFFRSVGAYRSGPRRRQVNTNAASHNTGVLRNHS